MATGLGLFGIRSTSRIHKAPKIKVCNDDCEIDRALLLSGREPRGAPMFVLFNSSKNSRSVHEPCLSSNYGPFMEGRAGRKMRGVIPAIQSLMPSSGKTIAGRLANDNNNTNEKTQTNRRTKCLPDGARSWTSLQIKRYDLRRDQPGCSW